MPKSPHLLRLLRALDFAAYKHRDQRRKGVEASPYVNHLIEAARVLAEVGVTDIVTLQAAILHDTIEDTKTTGAELEAEFGADVRAVVEEVTDDKTLDKLDRKRKQIEHAPHLSERAKLVKIADKISNVRGVVHHPPAKWTLDRRRKYVTWTRRVVDGCRGCNAELEALYDRELRAGRQALSREAAGRPGGRTPRNP